MLVQSYGIVKKSLLGKIFGPLLNWFYVIQTNWQKGIIHQQGLVTHPLSSGLGGQVRARRDRTQEGHLLRAHGQGEVYSHPNPASTHTTGSSSSEDASATTKSSEASRASSSPSTSGRRPSPRPSVPPSASRDSGTTSPTRTIGVT